MSATRPSSRTSSRSGCTSGMMELESNGSRRTSRRGVQVSASRAGAARAAAILLISRHLKAVKRDGGAHPPKCAAKGDLDNVCNARSHSARLGVRATAACRVHRAQIPYYESVLCAVFLTTNRIHYRTFKPDLIVSTW